MVQRHDSERLPAVVVGLGDVGRAILRAASATAELEVIGVVDPAYAGQRLRDLMAAADLPDVEVLGRPDGAYARAAGGVALMATGSRLEEVTPDLLAAASARMNVVSTCEELVFPWLTYPEMAAELEEAFRRRDVSCLGTGVNPGFIFDRLPAFLGGVTGPVRHLSGLRVIDLGSRRPALQRKAGAGLHPDRFDARVEAGDLGHVGLMDSAALAGEGLGLDVDEVDEQIEPLLAEAAFDTGHVRGEVGSCAGVRQLARAFRDGREVVRLELIMAVGAERPRDEIRLDTDPPVHLEIHGNIGGDEATTWAVLNAARQVAFAEAGLMSVLDLPSGR